MYGSKDGLIATISLFFIITAGCVISMSGIKTSFSGLIEDIKNGKDDAIESFEEKYNNTFVENDIFLNLYSLVQKCLGKHEARNYEVLKDNDGVLYLNQKDWVYEKEDIEVVSEQYFSINEVTKENGGKLLYVQAPYKNPDKVEELQYYGDFVTEEAEDYLLSLLDNEIDTLDLRDYPECKFVYKTDHHWTVQSAFNAAHIIIDKLDYQYNIPYFYSDVNNYDVVTYDNAFLGSIGIKVGKYYAGKDDFSVLNPKFETTFSISHLVNADIDFKNTGSFFETFIDEDILVNENYNNKYGSLLKGAYCETRIINENALNDSKVLVISHSYARPLTMYLSMYFKELRFLDPQEGRYNESYVEYIKKYKPDYVILMYNDYLTM